MPKLDSRFYKETFFKLQPYVMSETAVHYRYKSPGSFCIEAFKHFLYPNAITHTVVRGFTDECKSFKIV